MIETARFVATGEVEVPVDLSVTVKATPLQAWRMWATREGWRAFFGIDGDVQAAIGGAYELMFTPELAPGLRGSEGCQVLAFVPGSMLAFSWNAPPELPYARTEKTWVVVETLDAGGGKTTVRLRHLGFGQGGQWPETVTYFQRAWRMVLDAMVSHLEK